MNFYNEHDKHAADWLVNLSDAGAIPDGTLDRRDIQQVQADDLNGYTQCHFFAGIGGWPLALEMAGWPVDVEVWTGSCPCQPFSSAGKRKGEADERHLWPEFRRLIGECRPAVVFGEQVSSPDGRKWLARVRADLEAMGYAVGCADLPAGCVATPHKRQRLFWVADRMDHTTKSRCTRGRQCGSTEAARDEARLQQPSGCGSPDRLPDSEVNRRDERRTNGLGGDERAGTQGGERSEYRGSRRVVNADSNGSFSRSEAAETNGHGNSVDAAGGGIPHTTGSGLAGRSRADGSDGAKTTNGRSMDDAISTGPQGQRGDGDDSHQPGRLNSIENGPIATPSVWHDSIAIQCRDGKWRRIPNPESSVQPLAHGLPRNLGQLLPGLERVAERAARANRVGRLKGYGNAIVPQVAALFVRAFMELAKEA